MFFTHPHHAVAATRASEHPHHAVAATRASDTCAGRPLRYARDRPARSVETASVRGATKDAHLFSSNGQHEAASTPSLYVYRAGAAFEFGLLMLVTRTTTETD